MDCLQERFMESRSCRDGYVQCIKNFIEKRDEIPSIVRFHYWTERPQSMINNPPDNASFMSRLMRFFEDKPTPKYIEMLFGEALVEITEYDAVVASEQIVA